MDIRIKPFSPYIPNTKNRVKQSTNTFPSPNSDKSEKLSTQLSLTATTAPKKSAKNDLILSLRKITLARPMEGADKKGVLLYQQIERNKLFSNGTELVNRFHFKA